LGEVRVTAAMRKDNWTVVVGNWSMRHFRPQKEKEPGESPDSFI
jgi:hypothetical protein